MKRIRAHLSYANVMATIAVLFAMSGGAIAATGGFSSGGTLRACANSEGVIRLLKPGKHCGKGLSAVSWNQAGPAGAKGATGATGAAGAAGATGASGSQGAAGAKGENAFTNVVIRSAVKTNFGAGNEIVKCRAGEVAVGGGATSGATAAHLFESRPFSAEGGAEGVTPTAWATGVTNDEPHDTTFYAVCVSR